MLILTFGNQASSAQERRVAAEGMVRTVTLRELGLTKGIEFSGLNGYRELYFPAPRQGLESATLRLDIRSGAAISGSRYLQISVGGSILLSRSVGVGDTPERIAVAIDPRLVEDGFVRVTLRYSGALNTDRCLDERVVGDVLAILPDAALEMRLAPEAFTDVRSVASLLPRDVSLVIPDRDLQRSEIAAALRIAALLRRRGASITLATPKAVPPSPPGTWSRGLVMIGQDRDFPQQIAASFAGANGITAVPTPAGPGLLVSGESAAASISLLNSRWRGLADNATLSVNTLAENTAPSRTMSFEEFGLPAQNGELDERVQFDVPFSTDQLPRDSSLEAIRLELAIGVAPSDVNADASVFAFMNGRLLGSRRASGGVPTVLSLSVPDGLVGRDNTLSVRIQRPPRIGACANPAPGQPVQLLSSSALEFSPSSGQARHFFDLPQLFRGGVDVILPAEAARLREALGQLIATGIDLLPDDAAINVRRDSRVTVGDRPFILVSRTEPADTDPRLRFDQGALTISRGDGKVLVDLVSGEDAPTIAQMLRTAKTAGLWLRPGRTAPDPEAPALRLDRGDVAVIDRAGIALAFSTEQKQTVSIAYHDIRSWGDFIGEYRPWVVGGIWMILTALFVGALSRIYRRRSS